MTTPMSTRTAADKLGTDPTTLRVFLRSIEWPRTGPRYAFTAADVRKLRKPFAEWLSADDPADDRDYAVTESNDADPTSGDYIGAA